MQEWLHAHAPDARLVVSASVDASLAELNALADHARVAVVGGDGTLQQMLPAILARNLEVGLVPSGSGNDMARALGVSAFPWPKALVLALQAPATPIDVGEMISDHGHTWFASSLAAGFDAAVAHRALVAPKVLRGLPRYLWATFAELIALRRARVRIDVEGATEHEGDTLFVSCLNTPTYGAGMPAVPDAQIDDGQLDLLIAGRFARTGTLMMLPRLLLGRHLGHPHVSTLRFTEVTIESDAPLLLAADGEPVAPALSWQLRVAARRLNIVRASS